MAKKTQRAVIGQRSKHEKDCKCYGMRSFEKGEKKIECTCGLDGYNRGPSILRGFDSWVAALKPDNRRPDYRGRWSFRLDVSRGILVYWEGREEKRRASA